MRALGVILAGILAAVSAPVVTSGWAGPVTDQAVSSGPPPSNASKSSGRFRKSVQRTPILRAQAAARRLTNGATASPAPPAEGTIRMAAAVARKRAAKPASPGIDLSVPQAERVALQFDLAWTSDYNGLIDGEANDKTTAAVKQFQRNRKFKETGVLNTQERALLAAAAKARQVQVGWTVLDDPATGARLGVPAKQVPNRNPGKLGTRWASAQGQVQVETFRIREPGTTLAGIYEQQKKEPSTRRIESNIWRGDFFMLSGMQGLKKFYVRADFKDGEVRGVTVLYDQATENIMDPAAAATAGAFTAFPGLSAIAQAGTSARRKVEYGSGIVVSTAGHILTDRALTDGCNVLVVSGYGDADRQAEDKSAELALLRIYGGADVVPAALSGEPMKGPDLTLVGIADPQSQGGASAISSMAARVHAEVLEPTPQLGFSGAAVLDGQGRMVGMVELREPVVAAVGTGGAQPRATVVSATSIAAFLAEQKIAPVAARTGLEEAKVSIVRVICVRK
jgi:peptidoglycan hydrolase-like protein with peptidoglycan-binding domain